MSTLRNTNTMHDGYFLQMSKPVWECLCGKYSEQEQKYLTMHVHTILRIQADFLQISLFSFLSISLVFIVFGNRVFITLYNRCTAMYNPIDMIEGCPNTSRCNTCRWNSLPIRGIKLLILGALFRVILLI